jgi:hypothetical protein
MPKKKRKASIIGKLRRQRDYAMWHLKHKQSRGIRKISDAFGVGPDEVLRSIRRVEAQRQKEWKALSEEDRQAAYKMADEQRFKRDNGF